MSEKLGLGRASWFGFYLHKDDILVIGLMMYRAFARTKLRLIKKLRVAFSLA